MRITNRMISNNFLRNLNDSLSNLIGLNEKISAGRNYMKVSEDPATMLKAMKVRQNLTRISLYQDNVAEANDIMTEVESSIKQLNSILVEVQAQISQGRSDTASEENREAIAAILKNYQLEIFDIANTKAADKYIFGGADMGKKPFTLENGILYYHGVDVNESSEFSEGSVYYDIGLGLEIDASGEIIEGTAFNVSNPGSIMFGTGTDSNGITNNIYNILGDIAELFANNDMTNIDAYVEKLETIFDDVVVRYAEIGQKTDFLSFLNERLATSEYNAQVKQKRLEGIDEAEAAVLFSQQEAAYNAALAMGSKIIPYSLLDYMD